MTLTFGLLDGWWLFEDAAERIPGSPLLDVAGWTGLLREEGFRDLVLYRGSEAEVDPYQVLFVAESDGTSLATEAVLRPRLTVPVPQTVEASVSPTVNTTAESERASGKTLTGTQRDLLIIESIQRVLGVPPAQFSLDLPFMEMGVDSILAVDLINDLNKNLGLTLRTTDVFHFSTPRELCRHLATADSVVPDSPSDPVAEDSDEEFAQLLRELGNAPAGDPAPELVSSLSLHADMHRGSQERIKA
jgi:acyl carrier protein